MSPRFYATEASDLYLLGTASRSAGLLRASLTPAMSRRPSSHFSRLPETFAGHVPSLAGTELPSSEQLDVEKRSWCTF